MTLTSVNSTVSVTAKLDAGSSAFVMHQNLKLLVPKKKNAPKTDAPRSHLECGALPPAPRAPCHRPPTASPTEDTPAFENDSAAPSTDAPLPDSTKISGLFGKKKNKSKGESAAALARARESAAVEAEKIRAEPAPLTAENLRQLEALDIHAESHPAESSDEVDVDTRSVATSCVTFVPTSHIKGSMAARGIDIKALQRAVKRGVKSAARDGCWRYDYEGVAYITDETSRVGITCYKTGLRSLETINETPAAAGAGGAYDFAEVISIPSGKADMICGKKHATRLNIEKECQVVVRISEPPGKKESRAKKSRANQFAVIAADGPDALRYVAKAVAVIRKIIKSEHFNSKKVTEAVKQRDAKLRKEEAEARKEEEELERQGLALW